MKKRLLLLLYIAFVALFFAEGVVHFAYDRIVMPPQETIDYSNFETVDMRREGENTFVSVSNNPYFEMVDGDRYDIHTIKYTLKQPCTGTRGLYYTTSKQPMYSGRNMLIAKDNGTNTVEYILPMRDIRRVRLDVSGTVGEVIEVEEIVINYRPSFTDYFTVDEMDIAMFVFLPPVLAALLLYLVDLYRHYIKKEREQ